MQEEGEGGFLALTAAGWEVSGAGLASFHRDPWLPCRRASPWLKAGWICVSVFFLLRDSASSGAGAGGAGRLCSPGPGSEGCPPRCPPSLARVLVSGKTGGFFLPQERSSLRQGGEGAGGGGPGSSLPHGRCLTGSPKSPRDYGTGSRPLGAGRGGPGGLTEARGPVSAAAPRSSPSPATRLLGSRQASFPLM